ncbi:hypothetical protein Ahy_B05g074080 [Arachis hypogaea]|uniref:Ferredoxin thioredoxin reductase alpha chain domain-containing protein n=1 Tax=Arachis hypogaea TaxID=3818 RepID=A0A444YXW6_ARAHY|nr:hypothetical protein Ahy_B05g074080 [Arachis hypogaea]
MSMSMSMSSSSSYPTRACSPSSSVSVSPNCTSSWMILPKNPLSLPQPSCALSLPTPTRRPLTGLVRCEVAVQLSSQQDEEAEESSKVSKVGARVRVKSPLKVYHVPKVPELDLDGMEASLLNIKTTEDIVGLAVPAQKAPLSCSDMKGIGGSSPKGASELLRYEGMALFSLLNSILILENCKGCNASGNLINFPYSLE